MSTQSHTANRPATSQHATSNYDTSEYAPRRYTRTADEAAPAVLSSWSTMPKS